MSVMVIVVMWVMMWECDGDSGDVSDDVGV